MRVACPNTGLGSHKPNESKQEEHGKILPVCSFSVLTQIFSRKSWREVVPPSPMVVPAAVFDFFS
jgi:hypothetical protein